MERLQLKETPRITKFQPHYWQSSQPLDQVLHQVAQGHIHPGTMFPPGMENLQKSTTSLGILCQCLTMLSVKIFRLTSNLNLPPLV